MKEADKRHLTIDQYNKIEKLWRSKLSNIFLKNFAPVTYRNNGFPTIVDCEGELVRYIDSQHMDCLENYVNNDCEGLTEQEFFQIKALMSKIFDYTKEHYGKEFLVKASIVDSAFICRWIRAISSDSNISITEIGAGSGMLGAMLLSQGYKYNCIEVTQAFYLNQNHLLSQFAVSMDELVVDEYNNSQFVHIPYWRLWDLRNEPIETDIFTCNHALLEIPKKAILFYIKMAKNWMKHSKLGMFLIRSWGWETMYKQIDAIRLFLDEGFELIYLDNKTRMAIFIISQEDRMSENKIKDIIKKGFYLGERGKDIFHKQRHLEKTKTLEDLYAMFDSITINQVSPDEEFCAFLERNI